MLLCMLLSSPCLSGLQHKAYFLPLDKMVQLLCPRCVSRGRDPGEVKLHDKALQYARRIGGRQLE